MWINLILDAFHHPDDHHIHNHHNNNRRHQRQPSVTKSATTGPTLENISTAPTLVTTLSLIISPTISTTTTTTGTSVSEPSAGRVQPPFSLESKKEGEERQPESGAVRKDEEEEPPPSPLPRPIHPPPQTQATKPKAKQVQQVSGRKHSLTVPGEIKFYGHQRHHRHHRHHHHLPRSPPPTGMGQRKHTSSSSEPRSLEFSMEESGKVHDIEEPEIEFEEYSRSPTPSEEPSPSGSTSLVGGDDLHSTCSTCSSSGLGFDLVRKCTVSADSLLLLQHPRSDALSTSGRSASGTPDIRGLLKATSTSVVGGSTASSPGPYKVSTGFAVQRPVPKQQLEVGQKLPASLSSDQIHARKGELELVTGARSASPKLPARQEEGAIGGVEEPKPGEKKRKISIASEVFSRMGGQTRLARFLRRTHSAGCSKDIPSYALFLREKPMRVTGEEGGPSKSESKKTRGTRKHPGGLEDMKQRLRSLGRRHEPSSVRPAPEEALRWSESFTQMMSHRYGASLFKAFLRQEYSQENIEFWLDVEAYRNARPSKYPSRARKIYEEYIAVKATKEINVDSSVRNQIQASLSSPSSTLFDPAQRKIQSLLESDAYQRFLQSSLYRQLTHPAPTEGSGISGEQTHSPPGSSEIGIVIREPTSSSSMSSVPGERKRKSSASKLGRMFQRSSTSSGSTSRSPTASVGPSRDDVIRSLTHPTISVGTSAKTEASGGGSMKMRTPSPRVLTLPASAPVSLVEPEKESDDNGGKRSPESTL